MYKETERQLNAAYHHMLNYFDDKENTEELRDGIMLLKEKDGNYKINRC